MDRLDLLFYAAACFVLLSWRVLGRGHLAARLQGEDALIFAQVPILSAHEVRTIVASIRTGASDAPRP